MDCLADKLPERWWRSKDPCPCGADHRIIEHEHEAHGSNAAAARAHGTSADNLSSAWSGVHGLPRLAPGYKAKKRPHAEETPIADDTIEVEVDKLGDIDTMLRARGLDPGEWIIVRATVNRWEGFLKDEESKPVIVPLKQLKVTLRPRVKIELLLPADPKPLKLLERKKPQRSSQLVFVYGDDQRPNVDRGFEQAKLAWLRRNQPDVIIDLGDGMEFATISTHKTDPANNASVQECADDYASWLYTLRRTCPNAKIIILADNHVHRRLRDFQLERGAALFGVKPADVDGLADDMEPLLSIRRLLRLDEMNIQYIEPAIGSHYAESHYEIIPDRLVALHGYRTGANVGKKLLGDYGCSVIYGHVHSQDVTVTDARRRGVGDRERLYALGVGCGAVIEGGGGFAPGADWAQGALTVSVFPDGGWSFDLLNYENGVLRWRDQEYAAAA